MELCCFCGAELIDHGCNPYPVEEEGKRCCQRCDLQHVQPVRNVFGYDRAAYLNSGKTLSLTDSDLKEEIKARWQMFKLTPLAEDFRQKYGEGII